MINEVKELEQNIVKMLGSYILNIEQVSKLINKSPATLGRWRKFGIGPEYRKIGNTRNATIEYTARAIAEYIVNNSIKTV